MDSNTTVWLVSLIMFFVTLVICNTVIEVSKKRYDYQHYKAVNDDNERTIADLQNQLASVPEQMKKSNSKAINSSRVVLKGQLAEQMFPMLSTGFALQDMTFIGKLFDYLVVDGYSEAKDNEDTDIRGVYILDVKTGNASLSQHQEKLKRAIQDGRVYWKTARIVDDGTLVYEDE